MILRFYYHRGPHLLNGVFAGAQPVFAKLLPLRRDACKCQCARRAFSQQQVGPTVGAGSDLVRPVYCIPLHP